MSLREGFPRHPSRRSEPELRPALSNVCQKAVAGFGQGPSGEGVAMTVWRYGWDEDVGRCCRLRCNVTGPCAGFDDGHEPTRASNDPKPDGIDLMIGLAAKLYAPRDPGRRMVFIATHYIEVAQRAERDSANLLKRAQRCRDKAAKVLANHQDAQGDEHG